MRFTDHNGVGPTRLTQGNAWARLFACGTAAWSPGTGSAGRSTRPAPRTGQAIHLSIGGRPDSALPTLVGAERKMLDSLDDH